MAYMLTEAFNLLYLSVLLGQQDEPKQDLSENDSDSSLHPDFIEDTAVLSGPKKCLKRAADDL